MLRQIDRLITKELIGPWLFGVGLFSALLMAATYLGRLVGYIVDQAPGELVGQLVVLSLPAILVKTFTMAVLLAALLAFGRLSSDSEIVALRAGGASIYRIVAPVAFFSLLVAMITLSPSFVTANSFSANAVGTPRHPCVPMFAPTTGVPWIATPSLVSRCMKGIGAS